MNNDQQHDDDLEAALAPGSRPPLGRYRLDLATGTWAWSDEIFEMHGFEPGEVVPTTDLMLAHKHPDDRERVDSVLRKAAATGEPFSSVHRILDSRGGTRTLAVTGQGRADPETGHIVELIGYFIDVTEASHQLAQREASAAIRAAAQSRSAIDQAKGVLVVGLSLDEDEAFECLRTASNHSNIPVRELADRLMETFSRPGVTRFPTGDELTAFLNDPHAVVGSPGV